MSLIDATRTTRDEPLYLDRNLAYPRELLTRTARFLASAGASVEQREVVEAVAKSFRDQAGGTVDFFDDRLVLDAIDRLEVAGYVEVDPNGALRIDESVRKDFG